MKSYDDFQTITCHIFNEFESAIRLQDPIKLAYTFLHETHLNLAYNNKVAGQNIFNIGVGVFISRVDLNLNFAQLI